MARASASRRRGSREAPFGSVSATLAEARAEVEAGVGQRASLLHPSRPVTALLYLVQLGAYSEFRRSHT